MSHFIVRWLLAACVVAVTSAADAQFVGGGRNVPLGGGCGEGPAEPPAPLPGTNGPNIPLGGCGGIPSAYTGPGNIVASATAWYGLRGYNAAYAAPGTGKSVNVRRASDNATQDIVILATGALDIASANTFATTDATCTGTISTTTLTCASASSTPHAGSTLTGTGIAQPSFIVSCGTFTGGAGTCTLNASQTVSVGETITMQYGLYLTKAYDQTGNGNDASQVTAAKQPQLIPSCINANPCISFVSSGNQQLTATITQINQPYTYSLTYLRLSGSAEQDVLSGYVSNGGSCGPRNLNQVSMWAGGGGGGFLAVAATDVSWHAVQCIFNGTSSIINADNSTNASASLFGALPVQTTFSYGNLASGGAAFNGYSGEGGVWPSAFSSGNQTSMCHNQFVYWGTATSC